MAVPMVALTIITLLVPFMLQRLYILPDWSYLNWAAVALLVLSSVIGFAIGSTIYLNRTWARPIQIPLKFAQDLLAYDFYIDILYKVTVVWLVDRISRFNAWFDRYVLDGVVNFVGLASIFSGESLKYSISGQSQFYLLTILIGVSIFGALLTFLAW
jgi:NAD(P)H-quinone oxidoreductase subunit 5